MKQKKKSSLIEQVKAARKQSREEEIRTHGKSINYRKVMASKKQYNRKKNKADDEVLPYLFLNGMVKEEFQQIIVMQTGIHLFENYQIETRFSTGTNIGSPALIPNASYHVLI